ncbi:MAG: hypothetical protein QNJ12_11225 [Ilumatobacter sp.]|uniref:hypothetical protein n=1 Tax=Ilumatobacter sp. TaxID=1967498 RepID=UPI00263682F7|nr:hypothetical protein [Ilumatobacter sp.]MDJ0769361.1 hypothetical protein [Ilumatobacter sp.]
MKHLEDRLIRELGEIADQATASPDALPLIRSRASCYLDDDEGVVVMLAPDTRPDRRRRLRLAVAFGTIAAVALVAVGVAVLRSGTDDVATVDPTLPTETAATADPTIPTDTAVTVDTTTTATAEPWTRPPLVGEWVEVAVDEPWGPPLMGEIDALPGGGYVAVTPASEPAADAERDGFPISTVMWSPDGVEWFDGDPEREIGRPLDAPPQLAVASDRVAVVDGTDFSDHVPLAIGDPRTGSWDVVVLDYSALDGREGGVSVVGLTASDDVVLVAGYSAREEPAGMMDVVTWVVDPATGRSETGSFDVALHEYDMAAPPIAWVDGRWILFAIEDIPDPDGGGRSNTLWMSSDGLAWSQADLPMQDVYSLAVGPMGAVASTHWAGFWYSADGLEWTQVPQSPPDLGGSLTAVGDYGFVVSGEDPEPLQLVAPDGSGVYQVPAPFEAAGSAAASSGDTLLVSTQSWMRGPWLFTPS